MRWLATSLLAVTCIAACDKPGSRSASPPPPPAQSDSWQDTQAWRCETAGYVVTSRHRAGDGLWIFLPGSTERLETESTGVYSAGGTRISIDGMDALLTRKEQTDNCRENRPQSIREDAKLRGVDFWASGNEPPWRLEISAATLLLKTGYESIRHEFPTPAPKTDPAARRTRYATSNATETLHITLEGSECMDSMSGERFATTVSLELNGEQLRGCGLALH